MKTVKIFLASSIEDLKEDRVAVGNYFRQLNDIYVKKGVYFELVMCEDYDNAIAAEGKQTQYDREIADSELCFFLFFRKAGEYTRHEFEVAMESFKDKAKPKIITYFKDVANGESIAEDVKAFMTMLDGEFKHYYNTYGHIDTLKLGIIMQIKLMKLDSSEMKVEDGEVKLDGVTVARSENVPILNGNENLRNLTEKKKKLQTEVDRCRKIYLSSPTPENEKTFFSLSTELNRISNELTKLEKEILDFMTTVAEMTSDGRVLTHRQKEALEYFNKGDYEAAQQILDDVERENELKRAENKIDSAKNEIRGYIEEDILWIKAEKAKGVTKESADAICRKYEKIIQLTEKYGLDRWVMYDYAFFLWMQKDYGKAITAVEKLRLHYLNPDNSLKESNAALLFNLIAVLYSETQRFNEAKDYHLKAIEITERLAKNHPEEFEPVLAMYYDNIAVLYHDVKQYTEAEKYYLKSIGIIEHKKSTAVGPNSATVYFNIANLYKDTQRYKEAEKYYIKSIKIIEGLVSQNHCEFEADLAENYNNIATMYMTTQQFKLAEEYHLKAIRIRKVLADRNPDAFEIDLSDSYNNIACLYYATERYTEMEPYCIKAIETRKRMAAKNPDAFESDLADSYGNLAGLYYTTEKYADSKTYYLKAIEIFERCYTKNPDAFELNMAGIYWSVGFLYIKENDYEKTIESFYKSYELYKSVNVKNNGMCQDKVQILEDWFSTHDVKPQKKKGVFEKLFGKK